MTAADTIDGTVEEVGQEVALADHQPPSALFKTDDPVEVVEKASRVADALKDVIVRKQLFTMIQGKAHIGVEGWQLVGAMLGVTAVCVATEVVDGGYKATVEARTADGRVIGRADALCTKHEKRGPWKTADDYARLSMAQTRATSKALKGPLGFVVSLAGYQTTPSEEMTFVAPDPSPAESSGSPTPQTTVQMVGPTATKQLDDQYERYEAAGLTFERLEMQAAALGGELDTADDDAGLWHNLTREQGLEIYKWMQAELDSTVAS